MKIGCIQIEYEIQIELNWINCDFFFKLTRIYSFRVQYVHVILTNQKYTCALRNSDSIYWIKYHSLWMSRVFLASVGLFIIVNLSTAYCKFLHFFKILTSANNCRRKLYILQKMSFGETARNHNSYLLWRSHNHDHARHHF